MQEGQQYGLSAFPSSSLGASAPSLAPVDANAAPVVPTSNTHEDAASASMLAGPADDKPSPSPSFSAFNSFINRPVVSNNKEQTNTELKDTQPPPAQAPFMSENGSSSTAPSAFQVRSDAPVSFFKRNTPAASPAISVSHNEAGPSNALGGSKESDDVRKRRFEDLPKQNRFFEMKHQRDALRVKYIRDGVLPDPDKAQDLSAAKSLQGKCMEMCPEFEREEREFQNEGDVLEMFPGTNRIDPALAVKIYRRPAAGRELPLPEDVRPPKVLRQTLDYLFHVLLPRDPASAQFTAVQPFMWNRTRAIRQDFIVQGFRGAMEIECHERIARYHILCLHWKGGIGAEGWSEQQELEQLRKTIRSLTEFYADYRQSTGRSSSNEAEFRAYNLLLHMQDPETLREVEGLPTEIFDTPSLQAALRLRGYAQRSNNVVRRGRPLNTEATMNLWTRFFGDIKRSTDVTYLLACLAENNFSQVRAGAVKAMGKTYLERHAPLSLEYLCRTLGMDSNDEAKAFAAQLNCEEIMGVEGSVVGMKLAKANEDKPLPSAPFSKMIVELKRGQATVQDIVDGKMSGAAPLLDNDTSLLKQTLPVLAAKTRTVLPAATLHPPISKAPVQASLPLKTPVLASQAPFSFSTPQPTASALPMPTPTNVVTPTSTPSSSTLSPQAPIFVPSMPYAPPVPETVEGSPAPVLPRMAPENPAKIDSALPQPSDKRSASAFTSSRISSPSHAHAHEGESSAPSSLSAPGKIPSAGQTITFPLREAKQTGSHLPAAQAAQDAPAKASSEKPKRTVESIAALLFQRLLGEYAQQKVTNIGHQACLREARVRKAKTRSDFLEQSSALLYEALMLEAVEESVVNFASQSIADEFRFRSLERLVLRGRQKALSRAVERRNQSNRFEEVRRKLETRGHHYGKIDSNGTPAGRRSGFRMPDAKSIEAAEDGQLRLALKRAQEQRDALWEPATFFNALDLKLSLTPSAANIQNWTVGLSVCQIGQLSSKWLQTKLAVDDRPRVGQDFYREAGSKVRVVDLPTYSSTAMEKEKDFGLIIFELHSWTTEELGEHLHLASKMLASDRERLEVLSQQQYIQRSRWLPKLLLVCWDRAQLQHRKMILQHLQLGATSLLRFRWSQVELCCLDPPQEAFDQAISVLLQSFPRNEQDKRLDLEATSEMCKKSWKGLLERLEGTMSRELTDTVDLSTGKQIVLQIFQLATALSSKVLTVILGVSENLLQDDEEEKDALYLRITSLGFNSDGTAARSVIKQAGSIRDALFGLSLLQVQMCEDLHEEKRDVFSLLRVWLLEQTAAMRGSSSFPWVAYFERLLHCHIISTIEDVWLDCKLPLDKEAKDQLHLLDHLCQAAWSEWEWKLQELRRTDPSVTKSAVKRRAAAQEEVDEGEDIRSKAKVKSRRIVAPTSLASPKARALQSVNPSTPTVPLPFPPRPVPASISNLQALMASANDLLDNTSSL